MTSKRRSGAETRSEAQQVALRLFIEQGYAATSLREIADELGINKASLYYHFKNKEAIVLSLFAERGAEAERLLAWAKEQPPGPETATEAVARWVDTFSADKLRGIQFLNANPLLLRSLRAPAFDGDDMKQIGTSLEQVVDLLAGPDAPEAEVALLRMAFLSINAAVFAAARDGLSDEAVLTAARRASRALVNAYSSARTAA